MVSWVLLLFFRTLTRGFQLQHQVTLLSGHAGQQRMCSRWASIFNYDAWTAAEPSHVLRGLAGGMFVFLTFLLEVFDASKSVLSRSNASRPSHVCLCSLPARAARVPRSSAERPDAGPAFDDTARSFFGAGAGAAAVGSDPSLNLLDKVTPSPYAPAFFGIFSTHVSAHANARVEFRAGFSAQWYAYRKKFCSFRRNEFPHDPLPEPPPQTCQGWRIAPTDSGSPPVIYGGSEIPYGT